MSSIRNLPPPPIVIRHRPQLVIAGFLGAGKTTLLRNLLGALYDHDITSDVILNDYENAELDAETLRDKASAISPLSASCACCGGLEEMVNLALAAQDSHADCLLIELNGTADPIPLIETFTLLEDKIHLRPRWQITVIDARKFGRRNRWQNLEDIQLATSTHYLISHRDEVDEKRLAQVRDRVRKINPNARAILTPILASDIARAVAASRPLVRAVESIPSNQKDIYSHKKHGHELTHAFNSCRILLPPLVKRASMRKWLLDLPPEVIRAKALVSLNESPDVRHLMERIGNDEIPYPLEVPISAKVPASAIFIGAGIDPKSILSITQSHFGAQCALPS